MKQFAAVAALLALMVAAAVRGAESGSGHRHHQAQGGGHGPGFHAAEQPAECGHAQQFPREEKCDPRVLHSRVHTRLKTGTPGLSV